MSKIRVIRTGVFTNLGHPECRGLDLYQAPDERSITSFASQECPLRGQSFPVAFSFDDEMS